MAQKILSVLILTVGVFLNQHLTNVKATLPECKPDEITYSYTECDQTDGRWSIQVPKHPEQCQILQPKPPLRRDSCDFDCEPGYFFNLAIQACQECPAGTYSLGGGLRFDSWDELPKGFTSHSETVGFSQYGYQSKINNCSLSRWKPSGHFVVSNADDCTSTLSYSVTLKQPGTITFSYQYSDSDILFHFFVQNDQCQLSGLRSRNTFLNTTGTDWKTWKATLNKGSNLLNWQTTGIMFNPNQKLNPVRIRDIEVTGVAYTTQCLNCRPGSISEPASKKCTPCPIDTYSGEGSKNCKPCDAKREFAPPGSDKCLPRPPCKNKDYFTTHSLCDENDMTTITYKWVDPKICLETLDGSVTLPPSGRQPCSPCNPGFEPVAGIGCKPCPPNTFSNGTHECQSCPASTSPHYGLYYLWWDFLPESMKTSCISLSNGDCVNQEGWEAVGDQLRTVAMHTDDAYLLIVLQLKGFLNKADSGVYGQITFAFETECEGNCQLYFMKDLRDVGTSVVEGWTGEQAQQTYTYDIGINDTTLAFTWAFKKSTDFDIAHIYFINVTNVIGSAADSCEPCAAGLDGDSKCIPCPAGNYLDSDSHKCMKCSQNQIVSADKASCVECGPGTTASPDKTKCTSDCHFYSITSERHYDFTNLSVATAAKTVPSFTSTGKQYNHIYNFSLCNNEGNGLAVCVDNVTYAHSGLFDLDSLEQIKGMVCRSTALPMFSGEHDRVIVHSQPMIVASTLSSVTQKLVNESNGAEFPKDKPDDLNDVVYHMRSPPTSSGECPEGRNTYVHLRCSPEIQEESGLVEMMGACPDGTCNGCDFHFLWRSKAACPICTKDDYKTVTGGCEDGKETTSYFWKRYPQMCRDGVALPSSRVKPCTNIMLFVKIGVLAAAAVLLLTCVFICFLYKKNRKLEYKYHRLVVHGVGGKDEEDELPAADSCALTDSESDEDDGNEIMFQKKKSRLFGKKKVGKRLMSTTTGI